MIITLPDGRQAGLTDSVLADWRELTCPLRPPRWAGDLLVSVTRMAGFMVRVPPVWVAVDRTPIVGDPRTWLVVGDFAFLVLPSDGYAPWAIVSLVARGTLTPTARAHRNHVNAIERRRRAARRRHSDARGGARALRRAARARDVEHAG